MSSGGYPLTVSLREFMASGMFGPIPFGCGRVALEVIVGEPEATGSVSRRHRRPVIWKYGDLEFVFSRVGDRLERVYLNRFSGPGGSPEDRGGLPLDPWVIREGLAHVEFAREMDAAGFAYAVDFRPSIEHDVVTFRRGLRLASSASPGRTPAGATAN